MKYSVFIFLFLSIKSYSQKLDILLIGASHSYSNNPEQDFSGIHRKILKFNPKAFFGEFLSKEDERLIMDYWCKPQNVKRLEILRGNRYIETGALGNTIDSLKKLTRLKPDNYQLKTDLAHAYYLNQDVANGHYQYWKVFSELQKNPDVVLENYLNKILRPQSDTTGRSMKRLRTSEYAYIAFPMMLKLKIQELLPMDCQDYDLNWTAAAVAFYNKFEVFKKDTAAAYYDRIEAILKKRGHGFQKYAGFEKTSNQFTEWLNTEEAAAILASGDFYFPELYMMKNFPKEEMFSQIHWWLMRNETMCRNVVNQATALGLNKVVVIAGANHRKYLQDIFRKLPNVTVRSINEIQ